MDRRAVTGPREALLGVLSIAKFSSAPDPAAYYLEVIANERDDYYIASGEAPGRWIGAGSERLGLTGEVEPEALRAVLEGRDPASGEPLMGWRKVPGFDLTLSAPKSVSLLWGLGDERLAAEVVVAHDQRTTGSGGRSGSRS